MFHNVVDIHTSGHADRQTIEKVIKTVNPKEVICIHKEADAKLKEFFGAVITEYDRERVHVSDIKKAIAWFNLLVAAGMTEFTLPEE